MKKGKWLIALLSVVMIGCDTPKHQNNESLKVENQTDDLPFLSSIEYSNLVDEESKKEVQQALLQSGVKSEYIDSFFEDVKMFNETVGDVGLVKKGFIQSEDIKPIYDEGKMAMEWERKYPTFPGFNCRITSFGIFRDFIKIENTNIKNTANLFIDKDALNTSPKKKFTDTEEEKFSCFFSQIPTIKTKDLSEHIKRIEESWQKKGVSFPYNGDLSKPSLISVFLHSYFEPDENHLFIGHIGVLVPMKNGKLLFIEKLAFEEPYQVTKLNNRTELNDLLMNRYDIEWNQPNATPFIFENDQLLEGYRPNPNKNNKEE